MRSKANDLPALISGYLDYAENQKGLSGSTVKSYSQALILLLRFCHETLGKEPDRLTLEDLSPETILGFTRSLETRRNNKAQTRNVRLAAIRAFFKYVQFRVPQSLEQAARILAIPQKRTTKALVNFLTLPEIKAILAAPSRHSFSGIRDIAMLSLTYSSGVRVSEALGLTLGRLNLGKKPTITVLGKGRRERELPIWPEVVVDLKRWLAIRSDADSDRIFLNRQGSPLTRDGFAKQLARHALTASAVEAGIKAKNVTPHTLRHSCAMHLIKEVKDIRKVSNWLGHASLQSTETYLHADPDDKMEILEKHAKLGISKGRYAKRAPDVMSMLSAKARG